MSRMPVTPLSRVPRHDDVPYQRELSAENEDNIAALDQLQRHAEAIRLAVKQLGIATPGINAWTRFKIDVNRAAARRIDVARALGEIAERGYNRKEMSTGGTLLTLPRTRCLPPPTNAKPWSPKRKSRGLALTIEAAAKRPRTAGSRWWAC
jgi:hypothetical protein